MSNHRGGADLSEKRDRRFTIVGRRTLRWSDNWMIWADMEPPSEEKRYQTTPRSKVDGFAKCALGQMRVSIPRGLVAIRINRQ
jgi:hypothetical protein